MRLTEIMIVRDTSLSVCGHLPHTSRPTMQRGGLCASPLIYNSPTTNAVSYIQKKTRSGVNVKELGLCDQMLISKLHIGLQQFLLKLPQCLKRPM